MPIFEYKCNGCGSEKELIRKLGNTDETIMCDCCGEEMQKVITSGNFILNGEGWAKDGYKYTGANSTGN